MSDLISPESRVFHIACECYVIYLGSSQGDVRPFLRIGNSRNLTDEIHEVVSTTVITDDHVGNPLLEILNVPKVRGRYLGDTAVVETMKQFFSSFDLPTDELADYRAVADGEKRHMLWFYSSGNIHLRYDDQVVFDLYKQEKKDRHFTRLFEEAKSEFLKNPFRYTKQDFSGSGIYVTGNNAFWFEAGELLSLAMHPGFVARIMSQGVDPDLISSSGYNLADDELDSADAAVFIGLLKRIRQRRRKLRIITTNPELQRKIRLLFPAGNGTPASLDVMDVSGKQRASFQESLISSRNNCWLVNQTGKPTVCFGGRIERGLSVDSARGQIRYKTDETDVLISIPDGYPLQFIIQNPTGLHLIDKYASHVLNCISRNLQIEETQVVKALDNYLQVFHQDIVAGKSKVSTSLQQAYLNLQDVLENGELTKAGSSWFFLSNFSVILTLICDSLTEASDLSRNGQETGMAVKAMLKRLPAPDSVYPFFGDLYLGDKPILLWRSIKRSISQAEVAAALEVRREIHQIANYDEQSWQEDRNRLLKLIRSLKQDGDGELTPEQLALLSDSDKESAPVPMERTGSERRIVQKRTPLTAKGRFDKRNQTAASKTIESRPVTNNRRTSQDVPREAEDEVSTIQPGRPVKKRRSPKLWLLAAIVPLLLAGAVVLDFTGNAPWGRILRSRVPSSILTSAEDLKTSGSASSDAEVEGKGSDSVSSTDEDLAGDQKSAEASSQELADSSNAAGAADNPSGGIDAGIAETGAPADDPSGNTDAGSAEAKNDESVSVIQSSGSMIENESLNSEKNLEEFLEVDQRVSITAADIHLAANDIAVLNGFKDLDYRVYAGQDPDWIYPGNELILPGERSYTIRRGDTIWFLAAREIRIQVENDLKALDESVIILDNRDYNDIDRSNAADVLRRIARYSRAAALRNIADMALTTRGM